jgi:hypothetical protein
MFTKSTDPATDPGAIFMIIGAAGMTSDVKIEAWIRNTADKG